MKKIRTIITLKAEGDTNSGKSFLLEKIANLLQKEGYKIKFTKINEHKLIVINEFNLKI